MFIRVFREQDRKEILINTDMIWKIEVVYGEVKDRLAYQVSLQRAVEDPNSDRIYRVFVGTEMIPLASNPNSKVMEVIADIFKNAIKD